MRSNKLLVGCGIVIIVALVLLIVAALVLPGLVPEVSANTGQTEGVQVFLVQPVNGSTLAVNKPVAVKADAAGVSELDGMKLWVDNHLWEAGASINPTGQSISGSWVWTPQEIGEYTLMVRVTTKDGQASNSNVIKVEIVAEENVPTPDPAEPALPPELSSAGEAGGMAGGEVPPPPPFPPEEPAPQEDNQGSSIIPGKYIIVGQQFWGNLFQKLEPPKAPHIWGKMENACESILIIKDNSDNEAAFLIHRVSPGSVVYKQVAKLDAHTGTGVFKYKDTGLDTGKYTYVVYAVNAVGQAMSNVVVVKNTGTCQAAPGGSAIETSNTTINPDQDVTNVYCYMSTNGVDWSRIPPQANTFITATNGKFDVEPYLGEPGGLPIELDCWGWKGNTLVHLGKTEITYTKIAPPTTFRFAQGPADCGNDITDPLKKQAMESLCTIFTGMGYRIVLWEWHAKPLQVCALSDKECWENLPKYTADQIDGFRLYYKYPIGSDHEVYTFSGQETRIGFVKPVSSAGLLKPEYFVRAFKNTMESGDSNHKNP